MRLLILLTIVLQLFETAAADPPQGSDQTANSTDIRTLPAKTLNDHFPFKVPDDGGAWHARSETLRRRILVATGLWPMPTKTPLQAKVYGKTERDGFSIEKVHFQSLPGHYVTGLLFRPTAKFETPRPGVLCPHGHGGRMQSHSDAELASQISQGAEHFEESGRTPKIARCVQLARMGCVSFIFDMLGYEDSVQVSYKAAHRHQDPRPEEAKPTRDGWIFYSPEADHRCQSIMGLQTWNAIRSLDFLESLPDVNGEKLAVTGGSGGGTQSILLGAIDNRVKVSFPNGMVSTAMQGGCYCENCNLLRIDTGNVELAALFAPRPQAMTSADDWTRDMMSDGYPELRWLYAMIGNENDVYCRPMLHFKHNYNYVTRATMYQWMNRHLELGLDDPVIEQDFKLLTESEAAVWDDDYPAPAQTDIEHERSVCRWWDTESSKILARHLPKDPDSFLDFRKVFGGAWEIIFDQGIPSQTQSTLRNAETRQSLSISEVLIRCKERSTELPVLVLEKTNNDRSGNVIWTTQKGAGSAFEENGDPSEKLKSLLAKNLRVFLPDLMGQGQWAGQSGKVSGQRLTNDKRSYSAFTYGYNRTLAAERCSDLLTVIAAASRDEQDELPILLLGDQGSAAWSVPAAAIAGSQVDQAILVTNGFRYEQIRDFKDPNFVPGAVKYGDIPALIALRAPHSTVVIGEDATIPLVQETYQAVESATQLMVADSLRLESLMIP